MKHKPNYKEPRKLTDNDKAKIAKFELSEKGAEHILSELPQRALELAFEAMAASESIQELNIELSRCEDFQHDTTMFVSNGYNKAVGLVMRYYKDNY